MQHVLELKTSECKQLRRQMAEINGQNDRMKTAVYVSVCVGKWSLGPVIVSNNHMRHRGHPGRPRVDAATNKHHEMHRHGSKLCMSESGRGTFNTWSLITTLLGHHTAQGNCNRGSMGNVIT